MKKKTTAKIDRRSFLKSGGVVLPALAALSMVLGTSQPARADCFGSCHAECADSCLETCKGDCMGDCKGSCGGCDTTCTAQCKDSSQ